MSTILEVSPNSTLPALFDAQVSRTPDHIAVRFMEDELSYRELDARATLLALHLKTLGAGPDVLVAVFLERGIDMLVSLLGVLKSGSAYVPLDPQYPGDRLAYMLDHSRAVVVITQQSLLSSLPESQATVVCIDRDRERMQEQLSAVSEGGSLYGDLEASSLAYVIYTSGSTGNPKGVQIQHDSLVNFLASMALRPGISQTDTLLAVTTISFDISILELFLPLVVGARVVIASRETASDGELLKQALQETSATIMQATPTTWRLLLAAGWEGGDGFKVLCGGEALPPDLAGKLFGKAGSVWNMYGPTETTIWSTCYQLKSAEGPVYIGQPIANTPIYLLDAKMMPVPVGVAGELYIGGLGVARGYLHDPELTSRSFFDDPFRDEPGTRIYRTGDEVRFLSNGNIEYKRRLDTQVKVRGFRIELGEVEAALSRHPSIQQSAVIVRDNSSGEKELVAYIATRDNVALTANELRELLNEHLPEYMVPSRFVLLDALPMTPNGKIDRKAMPDPATCTLAEEGNYVAPVTEMEQKLCRLWAELLGRDRVGTSSNFFDLGGHSLLITRMWTSLKNELEIPLMLREVFDAPTIQQLSKVIEAHLGEDEQIEEIPKYTSAEAPSTSLAQQRFWFVDQLTSNPALYNLCSAFRLTGDLDTGLLQKSLNSIIARQASMRTCLRWENGRAIQHIEPAFECEIPRVDLSQYDGTEQQNRLFGMLDEEVRQPFDISSIPLFRTMLIKLGDGEHVFFFMPHHVIWDGWSFDIFLDELAQHYAAYKQDREPELPELTVQYADYSEWHNKWVDSNSLKSQYEYWYDSLGGELPVLELPVDHPRPAELTFNGAQLAFSISEDVVAALNLLGQKYNATINMVLLAAYKVLLYRMSGMDDLIVGSPIQGRTMRESEDLIGVFVNTLVLRTKLDSRGSFVDTLLRVRETCLNAYDNQDVPFERLVNKLVTESTLSRTPLFQVMYVFQEISNRGASMADIDIRQIEVFNEVSMTDLLLGVKVAGNRLTGSIDYSTDLFDRTTIEAFLRHYKVLLESIIEAPDQPVAELEILDKSESTLLLSNWNDTRVPYPADRCLHHLIEAQVDLTPDATAVLFEDRALTYRELDASANRLAQHLRELGVLPDTLVAVSLERSEHMLIAVLGVLKAGGGYVPMDPAYPEERLAYMLEHSRAPVMITQADLLERVPTLDATVVCLDRDAEAIAAHDAERPRVQVGPEHLAYVIYTSGSTGKPKGVQIQHAAAVNFLNSMAHRPGIDADDTLLAVTTLSFDIAVLELYLPLIKGARVVIASTEVASDGDSLLSAIAAHDITMMQATPATWRILIGAGWEGSTRFRVLVGGEALAGELADELVRLTGSVWNMYGPTETTVWSTCDHITERGGRPILIGRPIDNTSLYVLDASRQPVPIGVPGELYISGAGLARGYLHEPGMTEERFIADPISDDSQSRLYRTGDQVRYHRDGRLEYITRLDNQVKIRGFRIELGEIEACLLTHPAVWQGVVSVSETRPGDVRLVAYLVPQPGQDVTVTEVRKHLRSSLPEYMVPQHVVELDSLPMTPNGKIDRKALPAPFGGIAAEADSYVAPRTRMEQELANIWSDVLDVDHVGIHDNFFDLGGHSLLSMQVISRIYDRLNVKLTPRAMLMNSLEQLAQQCDENVVHSEPLEAGGNDSDSVAARLFDKLKTRIGI